MKRLICLVLTLIMLVSLVPTAAISASAADRTTSEAAITVLKNMMTFQKTCYQIDGTNDYRIGYGTPCTESHKDGKHHTINQTTADKALRSELKNVDKKVNSFGSSNKLSLKQYQFDSLSVFSYLYGTAWMNGNGVLKTAILGGADTSDMLYAMSAVSGNENRSKILVNMYKNNVYTNDLPGNYVKVTYHANDGRMAQGDEFTTYFNADHESSHEVVPTRSGYKFLGWYNAKEGGKYYSNLRKSIANGDLWAYWQKNSINSSNVNEHLDEMEEVNYTISKDSLASRSIFDKPSRDGKKLGTVESNTITVVREYLSSTGARWAKLKGENQWVQVTGAVEDSDSKPDNTKTTCVTVTNSYVNMRQEATIRSKNVGKFNQGEKLYIIKTKNADGFLWGEVAKSKYDPDYGIGWVALMYTNWNSVKDNPDNVFDTDPDNTNSSKVVATATVTANGYVNVRSGAGTGYGIVGSLAQNETVNIYEIKTVNGHQWGRAKVGWFCLTYADVDMLKGNSDVSNEGSASYTFTGTFDGSVKPYVDASINSNHTSYAPGKGDKVSIITLRMLGGETWAKIGWKETIDKKRVTKYGWVPVSPVSTYALESFDLSTSTSPVSLNPVNFTVTADKVTVREAAGSGNTAKDKLNKGYQFKVDTIKLVNEEIWGKVQNGSIDGWVNLGSQYVKRSDQVSDGGSDSGSSGTGKVATIVNADEVNVRADSKVTAKQVGKLKRGAVANVIKERDGWYKLDVDVDNDPETSSWVYKDYVQISSGSSSGGNLSKPSSTGTGIVANTYAGVNVRSGAGTAYAMVGKLLPGTQVDILETKYVGATRWGRMNKGWVCMDYITMITEMPSEPEKEENTGNGSVVDDLDDVEKTTTTAVYTGYVSEKAEVWASTDHDQEKTDLIRTLGDGDPVTIYELISVTEKVESGNGENEGDTTETVTTSYWARTNDGYIRNPQKCISLDALDEKTHTLTGSDTLNVRKTPVDGDVMGKLKKGDQVDVTSLKIQNDKVWGLIEFDGEEGWIRLDYMSEGAFSQREETTKPPTTPNKPPIGDNGNTGDGGFVNNGKGYRYTGKVINTDSLNVRSVASTSGSVTTTMKSGQALVIYETTIAENMAWGRCDAGWVYLYYVDLTPCTEGTVDARVVFNDNTIIYSDVNKSETVGTYARMSVVDIYEIVDKMARTDLGWVSTNDLLQ